MKSRHALAAVLVLVCSLLMVGRAGADEPRRVHVLSAGEKARETVLVDALRIYTRDLGRTVVTGGTAPSAIDPAEIERLAADARRDGDEVVVWFGRERPVLYALRPDAAAEVRETAVEPGDPLSTARTLALKVRALIAPHVDEAVWAIPPEMAASAKAETPSVEVEEPPPPPLPPPPPPPTETKPMESKPAAAVTAAPARPRRTWLELGAGYGFVTSEDARWIRHGFAVRLAVPLSRIFALSADASFFVVDPSATVGGSTVSARVWPVALALSARIRRPRWQLEGGPRVSLQIIDVTAKEPGRTDEKQLYSAGLGAFVQAAWLFSRHAALVANFGVEALVPNQHLDVPGAQTGRAQADLGWVQFALNAGFMFSIP
jgi:hypothetical protein